MPKAICQKPDLYCTKCTYVASAPAVTGLVFAQIFRLFLAQVMSVIENGFFFGGGGVLETTANLHGYFRDCNKTVPCITIKYVFMLLVSLFLLCFHKGYEEK